MNLWYPMSHLLMIIQSESKKRHCLMLSHSCIEWVLPSFENTSTLAWSMLLLVNNFRKREVKPNAWLHSRNLNGGIGSLFDPCVNAIGQQPYIDYQVWRWVIVPSDLARSLGLSAYIVIAACFTAQ